MDGTMMAVVLGAKEVGSPLSDEQLHCFMSQCWGKSFGKPAIVSKSKQVRSILNRLKFVYLDYKSQFDQSSPPLGPYFNSYLNDIYYIVQMYQRFIYIYHSNLSKQNGTVVIENPDMLKAKYANGHSASPTTTDQKSAIVLKGPTDKQVNLALTYLITFTEMMNFKNFLFQNKEANCPNPIFIYFYAQIILLSIHLSLDHFYRRLQH